MILDLTTLEKVGFVQGVSRPDSDLQQQARTTLGDALRCCRTFEECPGGFEFIVGLDTPSPADLGLRLLKGLPKTLANGFDVLVLADAAFGSNEFVAGIRKLKHHALVGVRCDRRLEDGRSVAQLHKRGQQVRLSRLKFPVHLSWYYFKCQDGKWQKRYVLCTLALKANTITWWGRRRWQVEGFFTRC